MAKTVEVDACTAHKVRSGETLESLAKQVGTSWRWLARFNFKTDKPAEVNKCLHADIGCTKRTADGKSYVFDDGDDPGIIFLPKEVPTITVENDDEVNIKLTLPHFPATVDLETVDGAGTPIPNVALLLQREGAAQNAKDVELTTDEHGYGRKEKVPCGRYRVMVKGGGPAYFWSRPHDPTRPQPKEEPREPVPAVLDTRERRRVTSVVVKPDPASPHEQAQRKAVASGSAFRGEELASSRGQSIREFTEGGETRRWFHQCTDNVALAAGWTSDNNVNVEQLVATVLPGWLLDHCPALSRYYALLMEPGRPHPTRADTFALTLLEASGRKEGEFWCRAPSRIRGLFGAYAMFEDTEDDLFLDIQNRSAFLGQDNRQRFGIEDIVTEPGRYREAVAKHGTEKPLLYYLPDSTGLAKIALHGGTGFLEDYPNEQKANVRVHKRNLAVLKSMAFAYEELYVQRYVGQVKATKSEVELKMLGPPLSHYEMPPPLGATPEQRKKLFQAYDVHETEPWKAIAEKLDELAGRATQGRPFVTFKVKYSYDASRLKDVPPDYTDSIRPELLKVAQGLPVAIEVEGNLELQMVDGVRVIKQGTKWKTSVKLTAVDQQPGLLGGERVKVTGKGEVHDLVDLITPWRVPSSRTPDASLGIQLGPYKMEFNADGKRKVGLDYGAGTIESEWDPKSAKMSAGLVLSFDRLARALKDRKDPIAQKYAEKLRGLEIGIHLGLVGVKEETVLAVVSRAPGFFDWRSVRNLFDPKTTWDQLLFHEQAALVMLGWNESRWNFKYDPKLRDLPKSCSRQRGELTNVERYGIVQLGFYSFEDYSSAVKQAVSEHGA